MKLEVVKFGNFYTLRKTTWFGLVKRYLTTEGAPKWLPKSSPMFIICLSVKPNDVMFTSAKKEENV